MATENEIDLSIALEKLHQMALAGGDLGYEYWYRVSHSALGLSCAGHNC